ncbi:acylaminoacyl-peptidase [Sulfolobales archaeon HS-7]|nr:acylaminoacyl-peptidase [Sulfolobales archaeon HS-7]
MEFSDLYKIKPVISYDVNEGNLGVIVLEKTPVLYVTGIEKATVPDLVGVKWISGNKLSLIIDKGGSERRGIFLMEENPIPLVIDEYDNTDPVFITDDKFYFLSNRGKSYNIFLFEGGEITPVTNEKENVLLYCMSKSKRRLAYVKGVVNYDVVVLDLNSGERELLSFPDSDEMISSEQCFTEQDELLFSSNTGNYFNVGKFFKGEIEWVTSGEHEHMDPIYYRDIFYLEINDGDIVLKNNQKAIINYGFNTTVKGDQNYLYFLHSDASRDTELWRYNISNGGIERLTNSMGDVSLDVRVDKVSYPSGELTIRGLLFRGRDVRKSAIFIHGGPESMCYNEFVPEIALLIDRGYEVLCPDYRGSFGHGRKFKEMNTRDMGGGDVTDVWEGRKLLNGKIAVIGESYGGYLSLMEAVKHPNTWCAVVAIVPFVNWFTEMESEKDELKEYDMIKMGNDETLLRDRSPLFHADSITAPVLLLAGKNDPRCPVGETMQFVKKMIELNKYVDYEIYPDEGHGFLKQENRINSVRRVVEFVDKFCGK